MRTALATALGCLFLGVSLAIAYVGVKILSQEPAVQRLLSGNDSSTTKQPTTSAVEDPTKPGTPGSGQVRLLVQNFVLALAQANSTGNYSVLHAFGAPAFQRNNPPEKLAEIFSSLRRQKLDLVPLMLHEPILTSKPKFDGNGLLQISGYYATSPKSIEFDLTLQPVSAQWRLFGISVKAVPAKATAGIDK